MNKVIKIKLVIRCLAVGLFLSQVHAVAAKSCFLRAQNLADAETKLLISYYNGQDVKPAFDQVQAVKYPGLKFSPEATTLLATANKNLKGIPPTADASIYKKQITPYLIQYYSLLQKTTKTHFDPTAVSESYTNWLIVKRTHPLTVNLELIAPLKEYLMLLGNNEQNSLKMAYLYSVAINYIKFVMTDSKIMTKEDWETIAAILTMGYTELYRDSNEDICIS